MNGPRAICINCGKTHERFTPFCRVCDVNPVSRDGQTEADRAYLEWQARRDAERDVSP